MRMSCYLSAKPVHCRDAVSTVIWKGSNSQCLTRLQSMCTLQLTCFMHVFCFMQILTIIGLLFDLCMYSLFYCNQEKQWKIVVVSTDKTAELIMIMPVFWNETVTVKVFLMSSVSMCLHVPAVGWRRGSVVRTSIFGWRSFPDLRLI